MENLQGWNSSKNGFWFIRKNLGFGNLIFDLGFSNEVVGGGKNEDSLKISICSCRVVGGWVALVILLSTKVQIL